jgi:hypothetical protein
MRPSACHVDTSTTDTEPAAIPRSAGLCKVGGVRVQIGPLSSHGVQPWIDFARQALAGTANGERPNATDLEPAVVEAFEGFLDEWEALARRSPEFLWVAEVEPEKAEFLAYAFFNLARGMANAAEARGYRLAPPEGEEFYQALVAGFLDALEQHGKVTAAFVEDIRSAWPGLNQG